MSSTLALPADSLELALDGQLIEPHDPGWDAARSAWQLAVDQRPVAVVVPRSVADVRHTVRFAHVAGLQVAPQSTGHNAGPLGSLDRTILLRLSALDRVVIDPVRRTARVEAGALWGTVTDAAAVHGLAALAGSSRDVGVVGYTLGGGLSWLARSHGLAASHVLAAEVVTADGEHRRIDAEHEPELFWALRGGGGSFAIVTALEFRLFPLATVQAGALFWPLERAAEVLHAWRALLPALPDGVTSIGRLLRFPPAPQIPEPMRGRSFVTVELAAQLPAVDLDALIRPLRELGPTMDTLATMPVSGLGALHLDPPGPTPATGDGLLLATLPAEALDAYLAIVGSGQVPSFLTTELRHLGGALRPGGPAGGAVAGGAVAGLGAEVLVYSAAVTPTAELCAAAAADLDALATALLPWTAATAFANFAERPDTGDRLFGPETHRRLRAVKRTYDPQDLIRANHRVDPRP